MKLKKDLAPDPKTPTTVCVFCGHAPGDAPSMLRLGTALRLLSRQGLIRTWSQHDILPGDDWATRAVEKLDSADVVLLLLSPDFLDSDFCYSVQLERALHGHLSGKQVVLPVLLRPCDWTNTPFGNLQAIPRDGFWRVVPITRWSDQDEAWLSVSNSIRDLLTAASAPAPLPPSSACAAPLAVASTADNRLATVPSTLGRWTFVITGTIGSSEQGTVTALVEHLRRLSGDSQLTLLRVEDGSQRIVLRGNRAGFEQILALHSRKELIAQLSDSLPEDILSIEWHKPMASKRIALPRPVTTRLDRDGYLFAGWLSILAAVVLFAWFTLGPLSSHQPGKWTMNVEEILLTLLSSAIVFLASVILRKRKSASPTKPPRRS